MTRRNAWLASLPQAEETIARYVAGKEGRYADVARYARDDDEFGTWLAVANAVAMRRLGISIFDLADYTWRDAYDDDVRPSEALQDALEGDDLYSLL